MGAMSEQQAAQVASEREASWLPDIDRVSAVVSASEAATALGVNERTIRRAIQRGELLATKHGRSFQITREALDEFRTRRDQQRQGPPRLRLVESIAADTDLAPSEPAPIPLVDTAVIGRIALPAPLTPFIGRAREVAALENLLLRDEARLVTLTGPGGVGKTRLALQAARNVATEFFDGAIFVPLATVRDREVFPSALTTMLGLTESDGLSPAARLVMALRDRELLLILDNFEHLALAGGAADSLVIELLTSCPTLTILVTSRTRLHLSGEHAVVVPPLALPERAGKNAPPSPEALAQAEAVQLFVDRAQAAWPAFTLTAENASAVAEICERLDGLPLAIELAAARGAVLSPQALLARLTQRLRLLTGGPHDQPARLRTMRDAIAWSHDLLDAETRTRFRRLAVFSGGFSLAAAEAVTDFATAREEPVSPTDETVVDALAALLASSLVQRSDRPDGESRFTMLETVREFALEQLIDAGEEDAARSAHAAFSLDLIQRAEPALWASTHGELLDQIETEHDNVRGALTWAMAHEPDTALRLASAMGPFWSKRSYWTEGRSWLERVLRTLVLDGTIDRAIALGRAGVIAGDQGDHDEARLYYEESQAIAARLGDGAVEARALRGLGILASNHSDFARATPLFETALVRFRALGDKPGIARCLNDLGLVAERQGDHDRAIAYQEEALPIARAIGDDWQIGIILGNLGGAYYDRGDYARGEALSQESLDICRRIGDTFGIAVNLHNVGHFALERQDPLGAIACYRESLALTRELDEGHLASRTLDRLGVALHQTGASRQAARLFGAAAAYRESIGDSLFLEEDAHLTMRFQQVRDELGAANYQAAWESGRSLPFDVAITEALALADQAMMAEQPGPKPPPAITSLSTREIEVLRLLADGQPDKAIANVLFISPRTASSHVAAIIGKLGVDSRTAAVAAAIRGGLV
jgi:excisionase family DNA binding protein